jgi:hypothetical protein
MAHWPADDTTSSPYRIIAISAQHRDGDRDQPVSSQDRSSDSPRATIAVDAEAAKLTRHERSRST